MNCRQFEIELWNAPRDISADMKKHLEKCPACRETLDSYGRLIGLARSAEFAGDNAYWNRFESGVWSRIEGDLDQKSRVHTSAFEKSAGWRQALFTSTAAAAAVVLLMLAIIQTGKIEPPSDKGENLRTFEVTLEKAEPMEFQLYSIIPEPVTTKTDKNTEVEIEAVLLTDTGLEGKDIQPIQATPLSKFADIKPARLSLSKALGAPPDSVKDEQVVLFDKMPHAKRLITPDFPPLALKYKKSAEIWIKALIDENGKVADAVIIKDSESNLGFEDEALKAAFKNEFSPYEIGGRPMPIWIAYKVKFIAPE